MPRPGQSVRKRLSDAKLAQLAREMESLKGRAKEMLSRVDRRKEKIIAELEERGTSGIIHNGFRITKVQNEVPDYDEDYLEQHLTARQWKKVSRRRLDKALLSEAVQAGDVDLTIVEAATTIRLTAPYLRCSEG